MVAHNINAALQLGLYMGRVFSHTVREQMPPEQVKKGLDAFRNPSKWPDWNSNAKSMLATKPETIDEGDHLAIFQVIKGSLIETKCFKKRTITNKSTKRA